MSFSFNWAGLTAPKIDLGANTTTPVEVAKNLGTAMRGAEIRDKNEEYAEMLRGTNVSSEIAQIKQEIAALEERNRKLRAQKQYIDTRQRVADRFSNAMAGYTPNQSLDQMAAQQAAQAQMAGYSPEIQNADPGYTNMMMQALYRRTR